MSLRTPGPLQAAHGANRVFLFRLILGQDGRQMIGYRA
jgi:hypothetical protein